MIYTDEEKKKINLDVEIEKLEKQKNSLRETIEKMGKETEELYLKRQKAAQEAEASQVDLVKREKDLNFKAMSIERDRKILDKDLMDFRIKANKLGEDKEAFSKERAVFQNKISGIQKREDESDIKIKEVETLRVKLQEEYDFNQAKLRQVEKELDLLRAGQAKLTESEKELKSKESSYRQTLMEVESERKRLIDVKKSMENRFKAELDALEEIKRVFDLDKNAQLESIKNRELQLIDKENEIEQAIKFIQAEKEKLKIQEARERLEPKEEAKDSKKKVKK